MSTSRSSSEYDHTQMSDKESDNTSLSGHDPVDEDDIWHQALWTLSLGPDDQGYLASELQKLNDMSTCWYEVIFHIPFSLRKEFKTSKTATLPIIHLEETKELLLNPVDAYNIVAATLALQNANGRTLNYITAECEDLGLWISIWLNAFDTVVRRIVDAESKCRIEENEQTQRIFKDLFKIQTSDGPDVLSCGNFKEHSEMGRGHRVTYYDEQEATINRWYYAGWLPQAKTGKEKACNPSLFHQILEQESKGALERKVVLQELEAEYHKFFETFKKETEAAWTKLQVSRRILAQAYRECQSREGDQVVRQGYYYAEKKNEAMEVMYEGALGAYSEAMHKAERDDRREVIIDKFERDRQKEKEKLRKECQERKAQQERNEEEGGKEGKTEERKENKGGK
ncbi:hypothetical protein B0T20DRAFT_198347 [Sordaria brevicollis]|uniref:Uncharacterized protein n=1 Tax=Sordaria brevicollis TaxID=83679 RepID=A0AAE0UD45_SORBR|nr:hypothetical protein B0T20DRAFT_198347 [Sordaria brevicollis]